MLHCDFDGTAALTFDRLATSFAAQPAGRDEAAIVEPDGSVERLPRAALVSWLDANDLRKLAKQVARTHIPVGHLLLALIGDEVRLRVVAVPVDDDVDDVEPRGRVGAAGLLALYGGAA